MLGPQIVEPRPKLDFSAEQLELEIEKDAWGPMIVEPRPKLHFHAKQLELELWRS